MLQLYNGTSFSLYIHVPFCASRCDYCDFYSSVPSQIVRRAGSGYELSPDLEQQYLSAVNNQLKDLCRRFPVTSWKTLYIGGGTPGLLSSVGVATLLRTVACYASFEANAEITVEVNPEDMTELWLSECLAAGITRISAGIQSFNDNALRNVHRRTSSDSARLVLGFFAGLQQMYPRFRWSADFIAGLPGESVSSFTAGLEQLLAYKPHHVSLYSLMIEEGTALYKNLSRNGSQYGDINKTEKAAEVQWFVGRRMLEQAGLQQYEVSNFAVPGEESRHNCVYWTMQHWLGIGPGASGTVFYENGTAVRHNVSSDVTAWLHNPLILEEELLDRTTCIKEYIMTGFRMKQGVSTEEFYQRFGCNLEELVAPIWNAWTEQKKAAAENKRLFLTDSGFLFLDDFIRDCFSFLS